jgi:addiction module RelE/StbE family toxin
MRYILSKGFEKDFLKLPKKTKGKTIEALLLFSSESAHSPLRVHSLKGPWIGHYSIDVTGDTRAIYYVIEKDLARFVAVGSHSELYG